MDAFKLIGAGQNAAMHVIKWIFNWDLASAPKLKAWDDEDMDTTGHRIFVGTAGNGNKSMLGAIGCTVAPAANWWPAGLVIGAPVDVASLLKGDDGFCQLSSGPLGYESGESTEESSGTGGGTVYANIDFYFPSDIELEDSFSFVLAIEYEYIGDEPVVTAYGNNGTEAVPVWIELTMEDKGTPPSASAGTTQIVPCDTGEGGDGTETFYFTRPPSGQEHPEQIWARDYPY